MRDFMTLPDGTIVCFFPDYFGYLYDSEVANVPNTNTKTAAKKPEVQDQYDNKVHIDKIELMDFSIKATDSPIVTHEYAESSAIGYHWFNFEGGATNVGDILNTLFTNGVVTLETENLVNMLTNIDQFGGAQQALNLFGARVKREDCLAITDQGLTYYFALMNFLRHWSEQYSSTVQFTWKPELYPGLRCVVDPFNTTFYVKSVTHNFSYTDGFTTSAELICTKVDEADASKKHLIVGKG
jgi:hypothetical protein